MEEVLKKEDSLTSWRFKLNKILGQISEIFRGGEGKSILTNVDGHLSWEPVKIEEKTEKEDFSHIDSLDVDRVLSTTTIIVNGQGIFDCGVDISGRTTLGSTLSLTDSIVLTGSGKTERIYMSQNGLVLGSAIINDNMAFLPSTIKLGENAFIGATPENVNIYGKLCPITINTENGKVDFPYGLSAKSIYFYGGSINASEYTGNAVSCKKLQNAVKIFGNNFDGSEDVYGKIDNCNGITLAKGSKITFIHGYGNIGAGWLECNGDALEWNGKFHAKSFSVIDTEHYAEWYPANEILENGDVVSLDFESLDEVYCKAKAIRKRPLGVVTSDYAMAIGKQTVKSYPVCNKGRVRAKVVGKVSIGDNLTLGSDDGTLRAMTSKDKPYEAWAIALESSDVDKVKLIKIHIL